jgi:hypothetical protein
MAKRGRITGNKRERERDKRRKREEKEARRKWRKELRARGVDPDTVDGEGNPLPDRGGDVRAEDAHETS